MCVTFIFVCPPEYQSNWKLIILNNRDEFISRKTSKLSWKDGILAGRDEAAEEKGTWFGASKNGKIGVLLSITQPENEKSKTAPSRGAIVPDYLNSSLNLPEFCLKMAKEAKQFNGFQFRSDENVSSHPDVDDKTFSLYSLTHKYVISVEPKNWPAGIYGFGNSPPSIPYKKVEHGKQLFTNVVETFANSSEEKMIEALIEKVATDSVLCEPDPQYELQRGMPGEKIKFLTSLFVKQPPFIDYGTRSHSILLVDHEDSVTFFEKRLISGKNFDGKWETTIEKFNFD
uniref:Uncharacterized protein n=1 Tax=Panagrolaimus sp. PS1159 TaxID=55785 RepID=A0AC35GGA0_9BILA